MAPNKLSKRRSKRVTCKIKYKIEKKVREHNRKLRKGTLKKTKQKTRSKKDPGVPNLAPFKQKVLEEAEQYKREALALKEQRRELLRAKRKAEKDGVDGATEQKSAENGDEPVINTNSASDGSAKAFYKQFRKVIEEADVVIEVLDARDPLGSRSRQLERAVLEASGDKKLVLLLNKSDLVPKENLRAWVKYLRREYPTLAFKSSTQRQARALSQSSVDPLRAAEALLHSQRCLGASALLQLLANYGGVQSRKGASWGAGGAFGGVTVGVVGRPNVGKSSVINSLKRSRACSVGAVPGVTRHVQWVRLDSHVLLLDSPGLVLDSGEQEGTVAGVAAAGGGVDTVAAAEALIARLDHCQLQLFYRVPQFSSASHFLALLAQRQGRLKAGGRVDLTGVATAVLHDWSSGRIAYHSQPPVDSHQQLPPAVIVTTTTTTAAAAQPAPGQEQQQQQPDNSAPPVVMMDTAPSDGNKSQLVIELGANKRRHEEEGAEISAERDCKIGQAAADDAAALPAQKVYKQMVKKRRKLQSRNQRRVDQLTDQLGSL